LRKRGFWLILSAKGAEMRSKADTHSDEAEKAVRDIRRATRRQYSAEEKVRIVIAGLRGEDSVAELCRKEGINQNLYYRWSKDFLEAGKAEEAHYWSFDGRVGRLVRIRPDRDYMKRLVDEEGEFWRRVRENRWPELDDQELDMSSDPRWRSVALQYRQARARLDAATAQERKLRIILDRMATTRRTFGCGVEVLKSFRRGTVDYAAIPQLSGVDLEKFRKPRVAVTKINVLETSHEVSTSAQVPF